MAPSELEFPEESLAKSPRSITVGPVVPIKAIDLIGVLDLTTLQGDDDEIRVATLCGKGLRPSLKVETGSVAAICVYPVLVGAAKRALGLSPVKVATVAGHFPHGLASMPSRLFDIHDCAQGQADEIDVVIRRGLALQSRWNDLYDELVLIRKACGGKHLKVILGTGELADWTIIYKASLVALYAGADFIKTSTGKEAINATIEAGTAMASALNEFQETTGQTRGLKPAGGIKTYEDAAKWYSLVYHSLGEAACSPGRFRIGASSLLDDLVAKL